MTSSSKWPSAKTRATWTCLEALEKVGYLAEIRQDEEAQEPVSRVRLVVEDADATVPKALEALNGADLRSLDIPKPSFDEVFFRLVKETNDSD